MFPGFNGNKIQRNFTHPSIFFALLQLFHSMADGYDSVSATCLSLLAAGRRTLLTWRGSSQGSGSRLGAGPPDTLVSLAFHSSFAMLRLAVLWLLTSVLLRNYRRARAELYRPAVDLQDYEMVELFLRRLKMWMGLSRAKEVSLSVIHLLKIMLLSINNTK